MHESGPHLSDVQAAIENCTLPRNVKAALVALMFCADDSDVKLERPQGINWRHWRLKQMEGQADRSNDLVRRGERSRGNLFMPFTQRRRI